MPLLNHIQFTERENQPLPGKHFDANTKSAVKKKPLADVGNTLHQSIRRVSKHRSKINSTLKGKQLFNIYNGEENKNHDRSEVTQQNQDRILLQNGTTREIDVLNSKNVEPVCRCCSPGNVEDDFEDIMFKNIRLTESQIEDLAMIWENPVVVGPEDIRELDLDLQGPLVAPSVADLVSMDPLFDKLPDAELPEIPPVDLLEDLP